MGIEKQRYNGDAFVGTFDRESKDDMDQLRMVKEMVSRFNQWSRQSGSDYRWRVVLRGRKPYKKMKVKHPYYSWANSKGEVSYDTWGNVVGGIENARILKAFIYRRNP